MKRIIIAAVASTIGGAAFAGDLSDSTKAPVVVAPVAPQATYNWAGAYGGIQVGGLDGDLRLSGINLGPQGTNTGGNTTSNKFGVSGATLGLFAGYNWMRGSNLVYGVEGEFSLANVDGSHPGAPSPSFGFIRNGIDADVKNTGAIRGRIGYAMGRTLIYATGGVAFAKVTLDGTPSGPGDGPFNPSEQLTGWTVGAGVEHALTAKLNLRLDYRYSDLSGDFNFTSGGQGGTQPGDIHSFDLDMKSHELRLGAVFRF